MQQTSAFFWQTKKNIFFLLKKNEAVFLKNCFQIVWMMRGSCLCLAVRLVKHAGLICGYHVLDIDEGIFAAVSFENLERFVYQVANVFPLLLTIIDAIAKIAFWKKITESRRISNERSQIEATKQKKKKCGITFFSYKINLLQIK